MGLSALSRVSAGFEDHDPPRFYLLANMIYLAKCKTRMDRCVGIAHTLRRGGNIELDMGYLEDPWTPDPQAEESLATTTRSSPSASNKSWVTGSTDLATP